MSISAGETSSAVTTPLEWYKGESPVEAAHRLAQRAIAAAVAEQEEAESH